MDANARTRLVNSAQELLWERGYVATSPKAIQARAGAGQGSMYHHFAAKSELAVAAIRRSADLLKLIDGHLVVAIPNISTQVDIARRKRRTLLYVIGLTVVVLLGLVAVYFVLPPLDILFDKIMAALFR